MRLIRPVLGMLLLTIGLPALLAGGCLWAALRHRDAGGAYSAELQRLSTTGYAIVVPDVDRLLRDDASFARFGGTELRVTALTASGPAFVGLAPSSEVAGYLRGVPFTEVSGVQVGTGELPVTAARVDGRSSLPSAPGRQDFWTRTGGGALRWTPGDLSGDYSLVIMNATGDRGFRLNGTVEARPGWLDPTAWSLISLGVILLMGGVIVLSLPGRRREIVYVVEPSQVPDLMLAIGAPIPRRALEAPAAFGPGALFAFGQSRKQGGAHRPRTLADSHEPVRPPALPQFAWPPTHEETEGEPLPAPSGAAMPPSTGTTLTAPTAIRPNTLTPVVPGALPIPTHPAGPHPRTPSTESAPSTSTPSAGITPSVSTTLATRPAATTGAAPAQGAAGAAPAVGTVGAAPAANVAGTAGEARATEVAGIAGAAQATETAAVAAGAGATAGVAPAADATASSAADVAPAQSSSSDKGVAAGQAFTRASGAAAQPLAPAAPAPGSPLTLLGETPRIITEPAQRPGRRRLSTPTDIPEFHATAVGAWVAQTAPERARQTEAQAAAALAEAARTRAAKLTPADQLIRTPKSATADLVESTGTASDLAEAVIASDLVASDSAESVSAASDLTADAEPTAAKSAEQTSPTAAELDEPTAAKTDEKATGVQAETAGERAEQAADSEPQDERKPEQAEADRESRTESSPDQDVQATSGGPGEGHETSGKPATDKDHQNPKREGVIRRRSVWPAPVPRRVALLTGPNATDWAATGLTRMGGGRPSPKHSTPVESPDDLTQPKTSAAQGAARVAAALGATKTAVAQPATPAESPEPNPSSQPRQRTPDSAEASTSAAETLLPSDAPTEPIENVPASDAPTEPIENVPASDAPTEPIENRPASDAAVKPLKDSPVSDAAAEPIENALAPEPIEQASGEPKKTPETEKREESKPPIVPFPTREPTTSPAPVPSARTAEPQRSSIHDAEAAPQIPQPESEPQAAPKAEPDLAAGTDLKGVPAPEPEPDLQPEPDLKTDLEPVKADRTPAPKQPEAPSTEDRPSIHAEEVSPKTGQPTEAKATTRAATKRTATTEPDRPLTRAQDRLAGATPSRQPGATTRKAPAAWIKAAETVAARAAAPAPEPAAPAEATAPEAAPETPPTRKPRPRTARPATEKPTPKTPAQKTEPQTSDKPQTPDKSQAPGEPQTTGEPRTLDKPAAVGEPQGTDEPQATGKSAPRSRSYLGEAAQLLAGATEPKRRRATTRRPKDIPEES